MADHGNTRVDAIGQDDSRHNRWEAYINKMNKPEVDVTQASYLSLEQSLKNNSLFA